MQEGRLQYMTGPEKRAIQELLGKKAELLSLIRVEVTTRCEAAESKEREENKCIGRKRVNVSQSL